MFSRLLCQLFLVKQKTAYEMRMSDWSSDVCSSDLLAEMVSGAVNQRGPGARRQQAGRKSQVAFATDFLREPVGDRPQPRAGRQRRTARKSVVSGQRVAVSVESGGRRIRTTKTIHTRGTTVLTNLIHFNT